METPERFTRFVDGGRNIEMIDHMGRRRSGRDPLDIPRELAAGQGTDPSATIEPGTRVAHLHLHVGALGPATDWFAGLGFVRNLSLPKLGMADMSTGTA